MTVESNADELTVSVKTHRPAAGRSTPLAEYVPPALAVSRSGSGPSWRSGSVAVPETDVAGVPGLSATLTVTSPCVPGSTVTATLCPPPSVADAVTGLRCSAASASRPRGSDTSTAVAASTAAASTTSTSTPRRIRSVGTGGGGGGSGGASSSPVVIAYATAIGGVMRWTARRA